MTCPDHNQLSLFVENSLSDVETRALQGHIDTCPDCFNLIVALAQMKTPDTADFAVDETLASVDGYLSSPDLSSPDMGSLNQRGGGTMIGRVLDSRYLLGQVIGRGGFAEVYRATQLSVGRDVAVKVLSANLTSQAELITRFESEAKIISRLKHPNILNLIDFGTTKEGRLYIVVELLEGQPIDQVLAEGPIEQRRLSTWLMQVCEALHDAHSAGIFHRDLKPSNLFLEKVGGRDFVKILDFGIAKIADTKQTTSGIIMGTPSYMSPEQIEARSVDHRTDLYSLGVIAFEALAGQAPFTGDTPVMVMYKHAKQVAPKIDEIDSDVHPAMVTLVSVLLEKSRAKRPTDATAVLEFLESIDWSSRNVPALKTGGEGLPAHEVTAPDHDVAERQSASEHSEPTRQVAPPPMSEHLSQGEGIPESAASFQGSAVPEASTRLPTAWVLVALALVGILAWWLGRSEVSPESEQTSAMVNHVPGSPSSVSDKSGATPPAETPKKTTTPSPDRPFVKAKEGTAVVAVEGQNSENTDDKPRPQVRPVVKKKATPVSPIIEKKSGEARPVKKRNPRPRAKRKRVEKPAALKKTATKTVVATKTSAIAVTPAPDPSTKPVRLKVRLSPFKLMYDLKQTPRLRTQAFSAAGDVIKEYPAVVWHIEPIGAAEVSAGGQVTFKTPGRVLLKGCLGKTKVCGSAKHVITAD